MSNTTVHVRGAGATLTATTGDALTVFDTGYLEVRGLTIVDTSTNGTALRCKSSNDITQPQLEARGIRIDGTRDAIDLEHCIAKIERSVIHTSSQDIVMVARAATQMLIEQTSVSGGGLAVASGDDSIVHFVNSVIGPSNTPGDDGFLVTGGAVVASFSTILNMRITCNGSISCVTAPTNGLCLQSSIVANLVSGAPASSVTACSATYSLVYPQAVNILGGGNKLNVNPVFVDPNNGDLHLGANSPAIDSADPSAAVTTDIEGTMRPVGPAPDMGAYERH